jgi:hypothetical protein
VCGVPICCCCRRSGRNSWCGLFNVVEAPELPEEIRGIEEQVLSASPADIESASLIVDYLEGTAHIKQSPPVQVQEVFASAALHFGFGGGSSICSFCEARESANIDYWISIADTCSRFAHYVQKLQL